ncbi:MAG: hypothetical protein LC798_05095 [Chloroflexi bacterium]|nr:hypothetical protein [Chloroflexota bacterium]
MRRLLVTLVGAGMLLGLSVMPVAAAASDQPGTVIVMKHLCNADIQSEADFVAVEDAGAGGEPGGEGTLPGLVATVLACPTVVNTGDSPTDGAIASEPTDFEFTVTDAEGAEYAQADGEFMQAALCESDIALDADGSGEIDEDVCLDVSMYGFTPVAEGAVTVTETVAPGDSRFGTVRFTPASTDEMTVTGGIANPLILDTTLDETVAEPPLPLEEYADNVTVLHVYNFVGAADMPDAAMELPAGNGSLPLVLLAFGTLLAAAGVAVARRAKA